MSWGEQLSAKHLSLIALGLLVIQNTSLVLLMRVSLTKSGPPYLKSTAVAMMEVLKLLICFIVVFLQCGGCREFITKLRIEVLEKPSEMFKLVVPAAIYTVQNNVLYIALKNLDAATYSVCYQSKILTTAVFSVVLLNKRLTLWKWSALVLLTVGVALTQLPHKHEHHSPSAPHDQSPLLGFCCVMLAACTSGFAGVYFEMLLKSSITSLWVRNIQMGLPSIVLSLINVFVFDWQKVSAAGFFQGYDAAVAAVIVVQAAGGLVVAVVVKYADNIRKSFATAVSIVASCFLSTIFFDFRPNRAFLIGVVLVCVSVSMYSRPAPNPGTLPLVHSRPSLGYFQFMTQHSETTRV